MPRLFALWTACLVIEGDAALTHASRRRSNGHHHQHHQHRPSRLSVSILSPTDLDGQQSSDESKDVSSLRDWKEGQQMKIHERGFGPNHHKLSPLPANSLVPTKEQGLSRDRTSGTDTQKTMNDHAHLMSPLEAWICSRLDASYAESQRLKCPFFRRRCGDFLDGVEAVILATRTVHPEFIHPLQRCRPNPGAPRKQMGLKLDQILDILRDDWSGKGYYIHGKLSSRIYRDDCEFSGPDPDMPVFGLRKYLGVAPLLFDTKTSSTDLLSIQIHDASSLTILAKWTMQATLRLPWRPKLSKWSGTTTYHIDPNSGLIFKHEETWDLTVLQAFLEILPWRHNKIEIEDPAHELT